MIPAVSGLGGAKLVTAALTGPKTIIVRLNGCNMSILHGKLMGQIMGLIQSSAGSGMNHRRFKVIYKSSGQTSEHEQSFILSMDVGPSKGSANGGLLH